MSNETENKSDEIFVEAKDEKQACELVNVDFARAKVEKTGVPGRHGMNIFKIAA